MFDVIVVGGGIAGCSAAIHLSRYGLKVALLEKRLYPEHKLCGEFLSVEASKMLMSLDIYDDIIRAGAEELTSVIISAPSSPPWACALPGNGLGVSRYLLDAKLFDKASTNGVSARFGSTVKKISGDFQNGFDVETSKEKLRGRFVLSAHGKRSALDSSLGRKARDRQGYVAFKQHYEGAGRPGSIEVHTFDRGYCGINNVEHGAVNVCWIAARSLLHEYGDYRAIMTNVFPTNRLLDERLSELRPLASTFCALGDIDLQHKGLFVGDICMIGDACQMIAPFCGDGMSMALQSAEIVAPLCEKLLSGGITEAELKAEYLRRWTQTFSTRIMLGKMLQGVALSPQGASNALRVLNKAPAVGRWLIEMTRGRSDHHSPTVIKHPSMVRPGPKPSAIPDV
jgi:menaquinone-9 beta-reductase